MIAICPNPECHSTWSEDELEYGTCDSCGYPHTHGTWETPDTDEGEPIKFSKDGEERRRS